MESSNSTRTSVFTALKSRNFAGILFAFITSVVMIPGMTTYLPLSQGDTIAIPILLFPFIWSALFLYCYLAEKAWHPWLAMILLALSHSALSVLALQ